MIRVLLCVSCALAIALASTSCIPTTCTLNEVTYEFGESFDAPDGCNECLCGEGGAVSCTEIACTNEPDPSPSVDAGNEPDPIDDAGIGDAGIGDAGNEPDPIDDAGTNDAGTDDAGIDDAGIDDAGIDDAGIDDAGIDDAGIDDAGIDDAGTGDAGAGDAGIGDAGPEPLRECHHLAQFNDQRGQCVCGTDSERPIDDSSANDFECAFGQCVDNCCSPGDMVDPNDVTLCIPKAAPYIQHFAMAPIDDSFYYSGYAIGADSCVVSATFANESPFTETFDSLRQIDNAYAGSGQLFSVTMDRNRFLYGGTMEVDCTGEFGSIGQTIVIPPADERYTMNVDVGNNVFEFCLDNSFFPAYINCEPYLGPLNSASVGCFAGTDCRASVLVPTPQTGCYSADSINGPPVEGDVVHWKCVVESDHNDVLNNLSLVFDYDINSGELTTNETLTGPIIFGE